ncbi:CpaF family protein [Poriferisphaera sp. WC338]|uniref:CpaF family protein n=1 Tax=Poriferisphaera sp. WC338 TaxID=3425129 RepID=UPI003D81504B
MNARQIFEKTIRHYLKPIMVYLNDPSVAEIMVNRYDEVYVEINGALELTTARFTDPEMYEAAINNILQFTGQSFTSDKSLIDARLPDGSRVHVAKAPCTRHSTVMTIRKFSKKMLDMDYLVELGSLTEQARDFLQTTIVAEQNMLVVGGTSSGKTSLLNALSSYIPRGQRIVVIEDSAELQLQQQHVVSMETKAPDRYGRGGVPIRELFRSSLRLRPDRIIIGEVRGGEALDMIQAMTSGHGGSMGTLHANNPVDALNRLETMAMMSEVELPLLALRSQVASAIDLVVQMSRHAGGRRLVTQITEIGPLGNDGRHTYEDIFVLNDEACNQNGTDTFNLKWTGKKSALAGKLSPDHISNLPESIVGIFETEQVETA